MAHSGSAPWLLGVVLAALAMVTPGPVGAEGLQLLGLTSAGSSDAGPSTTASAVTSDRPHVILVDGIRGPLSGLFPASDRQGNYLASSQLGRRMRALVAEFWQGEHPGCDDCLVWQGTFLLHPEEKITAVERVRRMIEKALSHTTNVTVIAHSQGAELAFAALQQQSRSGSRPTIRNLITLGSYLSFTRAWHPSRRLSVSHLSLTGQWVNVHAEGDPIGGAISDSSVVDIRLGRASDSGPGNTSTNFHLTRQHAWPYRDPVTTNMIEGVIRRDLTGRDAIVAHYGRAGSTVNRSLLARAGGVLADPFRFVADGISAGLGLFGSASAPTTVPVAGAE